MVMVKNLQTDRCPDIEAANLCLVFDPGPNLEALSRHNQPLFSSGPTFTNWTSNARHAATFSSKLFEQTDQTYPNQTKPNQTNRSAMSAIFSAKWIKQTNTRPRRTSSGPKEIGSPLGTLVV